MDVLKKIRSATLIETLTASVLIVVVFMVASVILNNIFSGTIQRDTSGIKMRILELNYLMLHDKIRIPYVEDFGRWEIEIVSENKETIIRYTDDVKSEELKVD